MTHPGRPWGEGSGQQHTAANTGASPFALAWQKMDDCITKKSFRDISILLYKCTIISWQNSRYAVTWLVWYTKIVSMGLVYTRGCHCFKRWAQISFQALATSAHLLAYWTRVLEQCRVGISVVSHRNGVAGAANSVWPVPRPPVTTAMTALS